MISSWDTTKEKSSYHFDDQFADDARFDTVINLGQIKPCWDAELQEIIATAKPATWRTRGYKGEGVEAPREDQIAEEYDLTRIGMDAEVTITHLNWAIPPVLKQITELFALEDVMERIHVQMPGEVWNLHLDKLQKWCPEDPSRVMRIMIQLTDWQLGQFWEYGNYHHNKWRAGEVTTFDWANVPHGTANAGHNPRVTFQLTGVRTAKTEEFLNLLKQQEYILNEQISYQI
jgi:hypothetical protein